MPTDEASAARKMGNDGLKRTNALVKPTLSLFKGQLLHIQYSTSI